MDDSMLLYQKKPPKIAQLVNETETLSAADYDG
jgi:hypothetical protein